MPSQLGKHLARTQRQQRGGTAAGQGGARLRRATVVTWDATDGYVISLDGTNVTNPPVLAAAGAVPSFSTGDTLAVLRQGANVLVLGKILIP